MRRLRSATNGLSEVLEDSSLMDLMNVATWDRLLRLAAGLAMLWLGWYLPSSFLAAALRVFALYPLISGLTGWCPIYALLHMRTRRH